MQEQSITLKWLLHTLMNSNMALNICFTQATSKHDIKTTITFKQGHNVTSEAPFISNPERQEEHGPDLKT